MNWNELDDKIKKIVCTDGFPTMIIKIRRACFDAILGKIENLDWHEAVDKGEDDYGRTRIKEMGDSVLIDDIRKLLM